MKKVTAKDKEAIEKERARGREKYYRLGYRVRKPTPERKKEIIAKHHQKYPEKKAARVAAQYIKAPAGMGSHHWSYQTKHHKDVFFLTTKEHFTAHRFMVYDRKHKMYRTLDGVLLNTRKSHEKYIKSLFKNVHSISK